MQPSPDIVAGAATSSGILSALQFPERAYMLNKMATAVQPKRDVAQAPATMRLNSDVPG